MTSYGENPDLAREREGIHNIFMHMFPTQLYIIRHAWAEECGLDQDDYDRRLTKKGRKRFEQFIRFMQGFGLEVDLIVTSPLVRTRETAEIMVDVLQTPRLEIHDALAPGSNWKEIAEWTADENVARVAWVGHAPCVGRLGAKAIGDGNASIRMQKGAIASICLDSGLSHPGELQWLVTAQVIEAAV